MRGHNKVEITIILLQQFAGHSEHAFETGVLAAKRTKARLPRFFSELRLFKLRFDKWDKMGRAGCGFTIRAPKLRA
jgi:hypothetical protein